METGNLEPTASIARKLLLEAVFIGLALLVVEAGITAFAPDDSSLLTQRARIASRLGLPFDTRPKSVLVAELRARGVDAYPSFTREWPEMPEFRSHIGTDLLPLSNVPRAVVVVCNEGGRYITYRSDEFGFANPPGMYSHDRIDVAAVGASYTEGHCVQPEEAYVARIRAQIPLTMNFGIAGGAALSSLATLREFVAPRKPRIVLWEIHPGSALLEAELAQPTLRRYLDSGFTQNLMAHEDQVGAVLRHAADETQQAFDQRGLDRMSAERAHRWSRLIFLPQLRRKVHLDALFAPKPPPADVSHLVEIVRTARQEVAGWGGELWVVIMPSYAEVVAHEIPPELQGPAIAKALAPLGVPIIDAPAIFERQHDPASFYTLRSNTHPNALGHGLLAETILEQLRKQRPTLVAQGQADARGAISGPVHTE